MRFALMTLMCAAAAATSATGALKERDQQIRAALPPPGGELTPAARSRIENTVINLVDIEGMARAALGNTWERQSPAKRQKFMRAFISRFKKAAAEQLDFYRSSKTTFGPEQKDGADVVVPSELVVKGEPTKVDYRMRDVNGAWRIEDIIVDGVSTVEDYRSAFAKIVSEHGFDDLIARLNKKPEEAREGRGGSGNAR